MNYKQKLDKIVKVKKVNTIISALAVFTFIIPFFIVLCLFPTLPPVGDRSVAYYLMYVVVRSELGTYLRIALISFILFIVTIVALVIFNLSTRNIDS
jgi:hypothetical protein